MSTPFYTTYVELDIETGFPLFKEEVPYSGTWEVAKKGRETQAQVGKTALANAGTDVGRQTEQYTASQPDLQALDVQPGQLSSAAQSQLAADQRKIQDTYNNAGAVGLKRIAQHGMGTLTGETSSLNNSLARGQASDELSAYNAAQQSSHGDMLAALNARLGLQQLYDPNKALGVASTSAANQAQQGSLLGDIGKGLTTVASLANTVVGAGGLNNLPSTFMNGKPS